MVLDTVSKVSVSVQPMPDASVRKADRVKGAERFLKQPVIVPPADNPQGFVPSPRRLKAGRNGSEFKQCDIKFRAIPNWRERAKLPLFWQLPEYQRDRAHRLLEARLEHWHKVRGKRPVPGEFLYAKIIMGIIHGIKLAWTTEEARALYRRKLGVASFKSKLRNGTATIGLGGKPRTKRAPIKSRAANVLGVV